VFSQKNWLNASFCGITGAGKINAHYSCHHHRFACCDEELVKIEWFYN